MSCRVIFTHIWVIFRNGIFRSIAQPSSHLKAKWLKNGKRFNCFTAFFFWTIFKLCGPVTKEGRDTCFIRILTICKKKCWDSRFTVFSVKGYRGMAKNFCPDLLDNFAFSPTPNGSLCVCVCVQINLWFSTEKDFIKGIVLKVREANGLGSWVLWQWKKSSTKMSWDKRADSILISGKN